MQVIRHPKDFWSGVMFIAFGGAAVLIGLDYSMGSASRMGPGYFPRVLGLILCAFGILLILRSVRLQGSALSFPTFRPAIVLLVSIIIFGLTVNWLGLAVSTVILVIVSSYASHEHRWKESIISAVLLAIFVVVAFRYGLDLQLPTWPVFLTR